MMLYNTLTKQKEVFEPLVPGQVKMYTCGQTVYDYVHIGNLRYHVMTDTLRRVLEASHFTVEHTKNITDVGHLTADDLGQGDSGEDKLVKKATKEGKTPEEIARFYTDYFHQVTEAMNILPPHYEPRATEYVKPMIEFIGGLIEKGHAYEKNGNVFFDVTSFQGYGKLSGNTLDQLKVGARLEEHPDKKNPWDFALWLKAPEGHLMHWASPWSEGYPGWHIECSAMNLATLGKTIDIHTGGEDNIFPHHEAEIAQSECGNDEPFVRYWVHARHLLVNGEKMSKSKGNFYKLEDIIERGYSAMDLRMLFLSAHYRSQMNFTWEALAQAKKNKEYLFQTFTRIQKQQNNSQSKLRGFKSLYNAILDSFNDDLNTSAALSWAITYARDINKTLDEDGVVNAEWLKQWQIIFKLFGLKEETFEIPQAVTTLLEERKQARNNKDFAQSDALRDEILALGYIVEDGSDGQTIRKK